jgi:hypothetical protein
MMKSTFEILSAALGLASGTLFAHAETWSGCVRVANTSNSSVTVTVDGYSDQIWNIPAADQGLKFLRTSDGRVVTMTADHSARPPIHIRPSNIPILWNFFTGEQDPEGTCANSWRIVVSFPICNAVDNVCP